MPFLLDGNPTQSEVSEAINYLLSNFTANLSSDPNNGQITGSGGQIIGYLYKYMMVKYADSFDGTVNFSNSRTDRLYYGLRNDNSSIESTNPADYIWYKVDGGFGTTKTLYYKVTGGRSIEFNVGTTSPGYAWVPDTGAAIDLDALTMAFTVNAIIYKWGTSTTPARPTTSTTYNWATSSYTAPSGWSTSVPSGGAAGDYLWSITIMVTQTGGIETSTLDWTNVSYPIVAVGIYGQNGQNGTSNLVAYLVQSQASPTPAFSSTTTGPNAPSGWSLTTPSVTVGQVLWYIQGSYNSSTTDTINGVAPNTTAWTGPIAASVFQDIRSDNWNGGNPPTPGNPATYGTQGYYIERTSGSVYLNNVYARNYIEVGGAASDVNSGVTTINGGKITANSITVNEINNVATGQIIAGSFNFVSYKTSGTWTCPPYVYKAKITAIGGGGGAGGQNGGGGGGGGATIGIVTVVPGTVYTVTVGNGGSCTGYYTGNSGTNSSFSGGGITAVVGNGGGGANGTYVVGGVTFAAGGSGGSGSGGVLTLVGTSGQSVSVGGSIGGVGGAAPFIGVTTLRGNATSNTGSGGASYGYPEGGATSGGTGGTGLVFIEY